MRHPEDQEALEAVVAEMERNRMIKHSIVQVGHSLDQENVRAIIRTLPQTATWANERMRLLAQSVLIWLK